MGEWRLLAGMAMNARDDAGLAASGRHYHKKKGGPAAAFP